jgi:hypothetical protein
MWIKITSMKITMFSDCKCTYLFNVEILESLEYVLIQTHSVSLYRFYKVSAILLITNMEIVWHEYIPCFC